MHQTARFIIVLAAVMGLSGCVISIGDNEMRDREEGWEKRQERNDRYIQRLDLGTSRASVIADLGDPDYRDSFKRDGRVFDVLFYRTHHRHSDGETTRDETTPVVFVDGTLVGFGSSAIDHATE